MNILTLLSPPEKKHEEEETEAQSGEGPGPALKPSRPLPKWGWAVMAEAHVRSPGSQSSVLGRLPPPTGSCGVGPGGASADPVLQACGARAAGVPVTPEGSCTPRAGGSDLGLHQACGSHLRGESPGTERLSHSPEATQWDRSGPVLVMTLALGSRCGTARSWVGNGSAHTLGFPAFSRSKGHVGPGSSEA